MFLIKKIAGCIFTAILVLAPAKSHAILVSSIVMKGSARIFSGNYDSVLLCVLLLPLCILNEGPVMVSEPALLDNGYSQREVDEILLGQDMVLQSWNDKSLDLSQDKSLEEAIEHIRQNIPGIPQSYLEFLSQQ